MKPAGNSYLIQLDGLRFIAIGLVLVDHFLAEINKIPLGPLGVTLFFVLSGFLITRILINSRTRYEGQPGGFKAYLKRFFVRRSLRIFPVYYACILTLFVLDVPPVRDTFAWCMLYGTNIYMAVNQTWMGVIDHFWSLSVEEQFYVFFPFVIFLIPRRMLVPGMVLMVIISLVFRMYFYYSGYSWIVNYVSMPACLDAFGLGAFMAWLLVHHPGKFQALFSRSYLIVAGLLVWIAVVYWSKTFPEVRNVASDVWERLAGSVFCFFLIGKAILGFDGGMKRFLENPAVLYMGKISYGLYAYHNLVYNHYHTPPTHPSLRALHKIGQYLPALSQNIVFQSLYFFTLTLLIATLSWYLMEKPINNLKDKYS